MSEITWWVVPRAQYALNLNNISERFNTAVDPLSKRIRMMEKTQGPKRVYPQKGLNSLNFIDSGFDMFLG